MTESLDSPIRLRESALAWRMVDGEVVGLDLRSSEYLAVNVAGALLWQALTEGTTQRELVATLSERFGVSHTRAVDDVAQFVSALERANLLEADAVGD